MAEERSNKPVAGRSKAEREFVSEAEEILDAMRAGIADLGDRRHEGEEVDPEIVNRLFRSAHSLKALHPVGEGAWWERALDSVLLWFE